ncbi:metallophosphoesterase family protein [Companilactobacillus ginsenosidimutans]|uniref:Metallophosphoesterase n=1 Tax=Companilactobacillus ginsenosidimutans TaxID=1007676 RepID=A0A0H4QZ72_9LACO|nr:DNA repair exonuclease [Companilactobacillus ginsenosidimutans]AKP66785.1 metallophosphoesterase [Companilactobacillus ginsenosidimutans]
MKFIHAADLHLDTPFGSIKNFSKQLQNSLRKSTYTAATKVFDTAIREKVDFVILAGDTYDNTDRSLNAQDFLKNQFTRLKENNIQVYLIYGNHDYYRNDFSSIEFPENVHIFQKDVETKVLTSHDELRVGLTGFSYYSQHIDANMAENYPSRGDFDYQIGILHGGVGDGNYAPFTVSKLIAKGYDYWALGHIHKRQVLNENPYVIYSGDTQGRNQNETGEKGFYLVTVLNKNTSIDFIGSSTYVWIKSKIEASDEDNINSLNAKISKKLLSDDLRLLTLTIDDAQKLNSDVVRAIDRGEILLHFSQSDTNTALYKIELQYKDVQHFQQIDQKYWDQSSDAVFNIEDIKDLDKKLFNIDVIRDHIQDPDFIEAIKQSTQSLINKKFIGEKH